MAASGHEPADALRAVGDPALVLRGKNAPTDPVGRLRKKLRKDLGRQTAISDALQQAIHTLYAAHRSWTYQLHYDNLAAWVEEEPELGPLPAYATVRRYMKSVGLTKRRKLASEPTDGTRRAELRLDEREVRSYESEYVNGLWHLDFHFGSKKVLVARGEYVTPILSPSTCVAINQPRHVHAEPVHLSDGCAAR